MPGPTSIPACGSAHTHLHAGQSIRITQSEGPQVVDTWAFCAPLKDPDVFPTYTYLSPSHTRSKLLKLNLSVGDNLVSNNRSPVLTLTEDTTPGIHDLLFAACDPYRYAQLGVPQGTYHASCVDSLRAELGQLRISSGLLEGLDPMPPGLIPDPVNLFMNVPVVKLGEGK